MMLQKNACLSALTRSIGRRGSPQKLFSDNSTNFLAARNDVLRVRAILDQESSNQSITDHVTQSGMEWPTIHARTPHFGGLWEITVRRMEHHLRRVMGQQILNYLEFNTLNKKKQISIRVP